MMPIPYRIDTLIKLDMILVRPTQGSQNLVGPTSASNGKIWALMVYIHIGQ